MSEFATYLPNILLSYGAFLVGIASPGPNVLAVMGTSMSEGRKSGMALALGIAFGSLTWATLTAFGLSALIAGYAPALVAIKIAGGLYLLYLSYKAFKASASKHDKTASAVRITNKTPLAYGLRGYFVMMTNPKALLAWIAIIAIGFSDDAPIWVAVAIVLGTFIMSIVLHLIYAVAFSTPVMIRQYMRARRAIQATMGSFFALAGFKLLVSRS